MYPQLMDSARFCSFYGHLIMSHNTRIYNILGNYLDRKALNTNLILVGLIQKFPIWKKTMLVVTFYYSPKVFSGFVKSSERVTSVQQSMILCVPLRGQTNFFCKVYNRLWCSKGYFWFQSPKYTIGFGVALPWWSIS